MKRLISLRVCGGSRGRGARLRHWRGVGILCRKSAQICRAERINDSLLGQMDGYKGKGIVEKNDPREEESEWDGGWVRWEKHREGGSIARSPSPERAAVNTQPLGGGS